MAELESVALFQGLSPVEWQGLRRIAQERQFAAGQEIFREGDPGDGVYFIRDGLVEIPPSRICRSTACFSRLGPGEIFGEMAVIEDLPRSATATAVKDTQIYFIPRDEMLAFIERSPGAGVQRVAANQPAFARIQPTPSARNHPGRTPGRDRQLCPFDRARFKKSAQHHQPGHRDVGTPRPRPRRNTRQGSVRIRNQVQHIKEMIGDILNFTQGAPQGRRLPPSTTAPFVSKLLPELDAEAGIKSVQY